ncbi:hypothetical protein ACH4MM_27005 [Streptomyces pratensis]|uniref:hypothetical protein n=1 Tax=Streptomyces pratensis TaxID=1169025 RepID=UPI00379D66C4
MTRWVGPFARRRAGRSQAGAEAGRRPDEVLPTADDPDDGAAEGLLVEDHDGLLLLRTPSDDTLTPTDVADLARSLHTDDGTVTVIAGASGMETTAFWPKLSELLDSLSESGADTVRLVMTGAGQDHEDRPATARRIADAWGIEVKAPDGPPLVVPGGSLFVPPAPAADGEPPAGGWWRFAPGANPEPLGPRSPEPSWQPALRAVPSGTAGGSVVEQIPAGLLVRPAGAAPAQPGDLYHAVPVDPRRPAVVIGVPYGEDVSAEEVAEILTALPEEVRSGVRLAPGGRKDVLPLAQSVSDRLGTDVEVMSGLPLVAAAGPLGAYSVRSVLSAPDGTPKWMPFVDAVLCRPPDEEGRARPPRLLRWSPPLPGPARPEEGVIGLTDRWQVTVTRAGLWVSPAGGPRLSPTARQVDAGGPVIELGMPGETLDASLWPALSDLLRALTPALRERATLHVHGVSRDGGRELRRLAAQHGLRTLRHAAPAPARPRPTAQARVRPAQSASAQPSPGPVSASTVRPGGPASVSVPVPTEASPWSPVPVRGPGRPQQAGTAGAGAAASAAASAGGPEQGQRPRSRPSRPEQPSGRPGQPSGRPEQSPERPGLPLRPLQPGRTAGSEPPAEGAGRAARVERARQLREAMAAGRVALETNAPTRPGTPGRAADPGTAGRPDGAQALGAPGKRAAAAPEPDGWATDFGRSDDPVPTGSPGRGRRPGAAGGPAYGAGATVPAPAERRESAERPGTPERDDASALGTAARAAAPGEDPVRTARPDSGVDTGAEAGAPARNADAPDAVDPVAGSAPVDDTKTGENTGTDHHTAIPDDPDAVDGPVAAESPAPAAAAETGDNTGTDHRTAGRVAPHTVDGPGRVDAVVPGVGSDAAGDPSQAADPVRADERADASSSEADVTVPAEAPGPDGVAPRMSPPEADAGAEKAGGSSRSGSDEPRGDERDEEVRTGLSGTTSGPRVGAHGAPGHTAEGNPPSEDGSEPSSARGPAETEVPGRPDDVPSRPDDVPDRPDDVHSPQPVRTEAGAPADPAPPTPLGSLASRDMPSEEPAGPPGGSSTENPMSAPDGPGPGHAPIPPGLPDAPVVPATPGSTGTTSGTEGEQAATPASTKAPDVPATAGAPTGRGASETPDGVGDTSDNDAGLPQDPLPPVPLDPGHRSSEVQRTAFRALAGGMWDRHGAAVARSLARMPALRGKEQEAARADLIALRMYLHIPEGPLSHGAVTRALREYEPDMLPYGACVASALNRLPSYRGAVLRGTGGDPATEGSGALPRPGTLLRDAALLSTTPLDPAGMATMPGGSYAIWSVAGRRVRQFSDHSRGPDEVIFAPGTLFRVLDVRREGQALQLFLRELTGPAAAATPDPDADRAILARLDDVVRGRSTTPTGTGHWPERCVGAVGAGP